ncbi:HNH endonuclease [Rhizobium leguminosarum]|uniref:HNH endonuclease n=1 Tax=Rhizobium leguminosarum TaxID=384 RepID=UPI003D7C249E
MDWNSRANVVVSFKAKLKADLRERQLGRCCYCRRHLPADPMATHLEHFIEKAACQTFTFAIENLGLSCVTCNNKKNAAYGRISGFLSRRATARTGTPQSIKRCPALATVAIPASITNPNDFRWVHPHLDDFSNHIMIRKGWIFRGTSPKGFRTVKGLELNALARLEQRARQERLSSRSGPMALFVGFLDQINESPPREAVSDVIAEIRRRIRKAT